MPAANYDLYIEQGATFRFSLVYGYKDGTVDPAGNATVIPYDITNCKARMQIRQKRGGPVLIAVNSTTAGGGGIVFTDAVHGKIEVTITDEATQSLNVSRAKYDLEIVYPSGDVIRVLQGNVTISPNITDDAEPGQFAPAYAPGSIRQQDVLKDDLIGDQPSTYGT